MPMLPLNVNLMNYVNSKFLYIEQAYKRDIDRLYVDTIHRRCLMRRNSKESTTNGTNTTKCSKPTDAT